MNIQLKTGNTISISSYEFYFILKDEDVEAFYESCVADNLGIYIDNPFSYRTAQGKIETEDFPEIEDVPEE